MLESRPGEAISRGELLQNVWGQDYEGGSNVVDAVIRGLRKKCGEKAMIFETVRGVGYRLRV
jgi:DNA-binding response OmpR family regulator